jgi:Cu2+-exporting ATPase
VLLSGDGPEVVKNVARELGIDEALGGLLPEEKADYVRRMRAGGCVVAMVGDGINDAPALASADVGISIAGSTDVALETADVVLLDGGLSRLEKAFQIGDQSMSSVRTPSPSPWARLGSSRRPLLPSSTMGRPSWRCS